MIKIKYKKDFVWVSRDIPFIDKDELKHLRKKVRKCLNLSKSEFKNITFQDLSVHNPNQCKYYDVTYIHETACYNVEITSEEYGLIGKYFDALQANNNARRELQELSKYEMKVK